MVGEKTDTVLDGNNAIGEDTGTILEDGIGAAVDIIAVYAYAIEDTWQVIKQQ